MTGAVGDDDYGPGVREFFRTPWDDVTVEVVEAFLADAGEEGLTWEAKGGAREPHREAVRKGVCGFANGIGGFFIIGAERSADGWSLPGVEFRADEAGTWLSSVIAEGLRPVPFFDAKVFDRLDGRHAALVRVDELLGGPCVTSTGVVYQRVSGQTLPVTDQRVLTELVDRGRAARTEAEALALRASLRALQEPAVLAAEAAQFSVAICPVQGSDDKAHVLFSESFARSFVELVGARLQPDSMMRYPAKSAVEQDCLRAWPTSRELGQCWTATAYWDGAVSAVYATSSSDFNISEIVARARRAWSVLVSLAADLGGSGAAHVVVTVRPEHAAVSSQRLAPRTPTRRWTELREPGEDELSAVERELRRGFGELVWEPEA